MREKIMFTIFISTSTIFGLSIFINGNVFTLDTRVYVFCAVMFSFHSVWVWMSIVQWQAKNKSINNYRMKGQFQKWIIHCIDIHVIHFEWLTRRPILCTTLDWNMEPSSDQCFTTLLFIPTPPPNFEAKQLVLIFQWKLTIIYRIFFVKKP